MANHPDSVFVEIKDYYSRKVSCLDSLNIELITSIVTYMQVSGILYLMFLPLVTSTTLVACKESANKS